MNKATIRHINHQLTEVMQGLFHCLCFQQHTGIEVYPLRFAARQCAVRRNLQRGHKGGKGSSPACGEEDYLTTGSSKGGTGHKVVAGGGEKVKT